MTSTGSAGDCYDNAMAESFFATLECELIKRRSLQTRAEARVAIFRFIEGWYNTKAGTTPTFHGKAAARRTQQELGA